MNKKAKRLCPHLLLLLVGVFAVLNLLARNHACAMLRFSSGGSRTSSPEALSFRQKARVLLTGINIPRPERDRPPTDLANGCRALSIDAGDGITLAAWYANGGEETPLVILFHGYSGEKTSLLPEAKAMLGLGASVLLVDFRGSGASSESYTTLGVHEADDVAAVTRYARDRLTHSSIILFGQSMGAVAILRAVHVRDTEPDAVILEAVFDSLLNTVGNRFATMGVPAFPSARLLVFWGGRQYGFDGFKHNPVDYAHSLRCPALFMHGSEDPRARLEEGRRVFDAVPGPKVFKAFASTGHEAYIAGHPAEWTAAVAKIIVQTKGKRAR